MQPSLSAFPSTSSTARRGNYTAVLPRTPERPCFSTRTTSTSCLSHAPAGYPYPRCSTATSASLSNAELASLLSRKATASASDSKAANASATPTSSLASRTLPCSSIFTHAATPLPMASITRQILVVVQPQNLFRHLARNAKWSVSGPISLLLFLVGMALAAWAAVRAALVRRVRRCTTCRGYGITRCNLCAGQGKVDWRAKFNYSDSCPLCMSKRFIECSDCGGHYHRPLFSHATKVDDSLATQQ